LNCIHFGKVCFLQPWCFKVVVGCVCSKYTHSAPLSYHMFLPKKNHVCYKLQHLAPCFLWQLSEFLKGFFPAP
jgi:hypothetical protein